jgi:hypothetical protein
MTRIKIALLRYGSYPQWPWPYLRYHDRISSVSYFSVLWCAFFLHKMTSGSTFHSIGCSIAACCCSVQSASPFAALRWQGSAHLAGIVSYRIVSCSIVLCCVAWQTQDFGVDSSYYPCSSCVHVRALFYLKSVHVSAATHPSHSNSRRRELSYLLCTWQKSFTRSDLFSALLRCIMLYCAAIDWIVLRNAMLNSLMLNCWARSHY